MKAIGFAVLSLCVSLLAIRASPADDDNAAELKKIEGRFERFFQNAAGITFHAVKDVAGDQSSVTTYDDVENVIESHGSSIKVEKRGPVRGLSYFNLVVTAGPNKGHTELERIQIRCSVAS